MAFSENLKKIREENGVSQAELAKKVGVNQSLVARCEQGSRIPNIVLGVELATALGTTVETLVNGADDKV